MSESDGSPVLVDAHLHLQEEVLEGHVEGVIARARAEGVRCMVSNGTHPGDWQWNLQIAEGHPDVVPAFGVHPWFVEDLPGDWLDRLEALLRSVPSGVGEVGIDACADAKWGRSPFPTDSSLLVLTSAGKGLRPHFARQEAVFRAQLDLAGRLDRTVTIHCVRASGRLLGILNDIGPMPRGFLLHAFGGPAEMVPQFARLGAFFSVGGNVLDARHRRARAALRVIPPERLLLETDAPTMVPPPEFRPFSIPADDGRVWNEPANLPAIARGVADLLSLSPDELVNLTGANAQRFFGELLCHTRAS